LREAITDNISDYRNDLMRADDAINNLECAIEALPHDSSALDKYVLDKQVEVLEEAAEFVNRNLYDNWTYATELRRMANELKEPK